MKVFSVCVDAMITIHPMVEFNVLANDEEIAKMEAKEKFLEQLIEYDGWQHYYNAGAKWDKDGRFETRQEHDKIKNEYCKKNNIPLIRITSKDYSNIKISDLILKGE